VKESGMIVVTIAGHAHLLTRRDAGFLAESLDTALQVPDSKTVRFTRNGVNSGGVSIHVERSGLPRNGATTLTDC